MTSSDSGLEVIGASWGRTGTTSFRAAMAILLTKDDGSEGKCYHMRDSMIHRHAKFWVDVASGDNTKRVNALRKMFIDLGYNSSCDWPSSPYWNEQLQAFPNAKVVLATRDPESWYQSMMDIVG